MQKVQIVFAVGHKDNIAGRFGDDGNNAGISKKPVVKVHVILLVAGILVLSAVLAILVASGRTYIWRLFRTCQGKR